MTGTITLRAATARDLTSIAALHGSEISEGFLVSLGPRFLRRLYRRASSRDGSFVLVACDSEDRVAGFVAVAHDTSSFYRDFLVHDALVAGLAALPRIICHPWRSVETLRYGSGGEHPPGAEILAIAVASSARGAGVGCVLLEGALAHLGASGVREAHVVTATTNDAAHHLYHAAGFRPFGEVEVHSGVVQEVLVWP